MIKRLLKSYSQLIESFLSLSVLNGLNILLPLITLPYILRIIGEECYGIYSFVYAIIQYILLIGNYGFIYSATKQISQHRDKIDEVSVIYNAVIFSRLILTLCGVLFFFIIVSFLFDSNDEFLIFFLGLGIVFGDIFIPVWLFQGMEKMRYLTIINFISKVLFTILIFITLHSPQDYIYIILFNSMGFIVAGLCSTLIVYKLFGIKFHLPTCLQIKFQLKEGLVVFSSTISMELYRNSNIFILSFFVSDSAVGIYSASEKVIKGVQGLISPVSQALFPHLGHRFHGRTNKDNVRLLIKIAGRLALLLAFLTIFVALGARYISDILFKTQIEEAIILIRIMSLVIFLGGLNYLLGIVGLVNLNLQKLFLKGVVLSGIVSFVFLLIFVKGIGVEAAAVSMVIAELILFISCICYLCKIYK